MTKQQSASAPKIKCKFDKLTNPKLLKPYPKNRNNHTKDQIKRLAELLKYQGIRAPIVLSSLSKCIVKGHGTRLAIMENGWDKAPVVIQKFDDEDQEYAFVQSDNAIAEWATLDLSQINLDLGDFDPSFNLDMLGIKGFVLEPADNYAGQDADLIPKTKQNELGVQLGDVYQLGEHRLMCGDSTDKETVEKLMNGGKAELCFTSPPYGDQREYNDKSLNLNINHIAKFINVSSDYVNYYAVVLGSMRKDGAVYPYWDSFIQAAKESDLKLLSWNIWNKMNDVLMFSFIQMFAVNHEWIFVFGKEAKKLIPTVKNQHGGEFHNHLGVRQKDGTLKKMGSVVIREFSQLRTILDCTPQKARNNDFDHPAMFCVELPEKYIEAFVDKNQSVYEPFCGSGSTLIACEKTNRKCYGMELDPHYCSVIIKRWEQFTSQKAKKL